MATSCSTFENRIFFLFFKAVKKTSVSVPKRHYFGALQDQKNPAGQPTQVSLPTERRLCVGCLLPAQNFSLLHFSPRGPCIVCALRWRQILCVFPPPFDIIPPFIWCFQIKSVLSCNFARLSIVMQPISNKQSYQTPKCGAISMLLLRWSWYAYLIIKISLRGCLWF